MSALRIVFAGTPDFSVPSLQALIESEFDVVAVYTQPDRPAGRGRKLTPSPVKQCALDNSIPIFQPLSLKGGDAQAELVALKPDLMVVAAYGLILPQAALDIPRLGCINIHASLLPAYRGASPIQQALLNGDSQSGITLMQMDKGLDTGAILKHIPCDIATNETGQSLHDKLATLANDNLLQVIDALNKGTALPLVQDDSQATYAPKICKADGLIHWTQPALTIERLVRAFNPWPVAHTRIHEQTVRVWMAKTLTVITDAAPGTLVAVSAEGLDIAAGEGSVLRVTELQLAGAKKMAVKDCLNAKAELFSVGIRMGV